VTEPDSGHRPGGYRYGVVLLLAFALVVFQVLTSGGDWSRAVVVALQSAALLVVVATSRARSEVRRARATAVGAGALVLVAGVAAGVVPIAVTFLVIVALNTAVPLALVAGLLRMIRTRGVTVQAVAGALAIYLLVGLLFAAMISFVANVDDAAYFTQGSDGSSSERVYFSFTVLTTTGFGDFTAATSVGRSLAVVEMLLGQIYLVTIIGILVGNLARRQGD
jgi:hypothetical protein